MALLPYPIECLICKYMKMEDPCPRCKGERSEDREPSDVEIQKQLFEQDVEEVAQNC